MTQQNDQKILLILILLLFIFILGGCALSTYLLKEGFIPSSSNLTLRCYDKNNTFMGTFEDTQDGESFFSTGAQTRYFMVNNKITEMDCYYDKYLIKS